MRARRTTSYSKPRATHPIRNVHATILRVPAIYNIALTYLNDGRHKHLTDTGGTLGARHGRGREAGRPEAARPLLRRHTQGFLPFC